MMEQTLVYYKDQYLDELDSPVLSYDGNKVCFTQNIFFPQTKGEIADFGSVNGVAVENVEKKDGKVVVHLKGEPSIQKDQSAKQKIDWNRRLNGMRLHSALHVAAGIMERDHGIRAVAGKVYEDKGTLTFKKPVPAMIYLALEDAVNEFINSEKDIRTYWDEKREGFRWCQIGDLEPIPCGGLHVKNTKEIGELELAGNGEKLEIRLRN